jgi:thiol-disulfide isomerase/thioredoxin
MTRILGNRWSAGVLVWGIVLLIAPTLLLSADIQNDGGKPNKDQSAGSESKVPKTDASAESGDPFTLPDGNSKQLLEFIEKVSKVEVPKTGSIDEKRAFVTKSRRAILQAADKILAARPEGEMRLAALKAKLQALALIDQLNKDSQAHKQWHALAEELKSDGQPEVAKMAAEFSLGMQLNDLAHGRIDEAPKLWKEVKAALLAAPDDLQNIQLAMMVAQELEFADKGEDLAAQAYRDLKDILSKSKDPRIVEQAAKFEGAIRRLSLVGKPIEIKGDLLGGKPFDPATLKGKVVLVDFWATWCGPCRAELPNVKQNYEKYHAKGFEVVGVSLDNDKQALEDFIADQKISWPILFSEKQDSQGFDHPLARYYGVGGIPTVILTNQKGEVVSLRAHGKELTSKLEELLGKPDDKK